MAPRALQPAVSLWDIGRETVDLFGAHAGMVLCSALIGFAGVGMVAQSLSLIMGDARGLDVPAICLAAAGLLLQPLGQGALAWIGLHGATAPTSPIVAVRAAFRRWPFLLRGTLLHALLTFACAVGFSLVIGAGPMESTGGARPDPPDVPRLVAVRSVDAITLGPLHPLAELVPLARVALTQLALQPIEDGFAGTDLVRRFETYIPGARPADLQSAYRMVLVLNARAIWANTALSYVPIALACLLLLVAAEALLRFRAVAAMRLEPSSELARVAIFAPLIISARLGLRCLRPVLASTWGLRLVLSAIQIVCIIAPVAVADRVVLPQIAGASWIGPASRLLCIVAGVMVSAILAAFCSLYDARLFVALQQIEWGE